MREEIHHGEVETGAKYQLPQIHFALTLLEPLSQLTIALKNVQLRQATGVHCLKYSDKIPAIELQKPLALKQLPK